MMKMVPAVPLLFALLVLLPSHGEGQLRWGAHGVQAQDAFGGTYGAGLRLGLEAPFLPFDLFATGEYFLPDCPPGADGCGLRGASIEANMRMVFPVVRPYISGGLAYRQFTAGGGVPTETSSGVTVGAGVDIGLGRVRLFGEGRYEFVKAPERQRVLRIGILLGGG